HVGEAVVKPVGEAGRAEDGERDLRRALALDPEQPQAKRNLALLLARRGGSGLTSSAHSPPSR
ncbi:MAG TPA: hypothetical protein VGS57_05490, partial [Thermoanaerobaculia bacterium]|nr:hypothetical protein [Thermoanaerobaculia bacterium]